MDLMHIAATGMQGDLDRLSTISHNLANVSTAGYKRRLTASSPVTGFAEQLQFAATAASMAASAATSNAASTTTAPESMTYIDPAAGTIRVTGNPLDIAIEGDGFFEVMTPQGPAYTRQGNFRLDGSGRLVTEHGHAVMGTRGELLVSGTGTNLRISRQGEVTQGDQAANPPAIGQLKAVRFAQATALTPLGGGLYAQGGAQFANEATGNARPAAGVRNDSSLKPVEAGFRSGALENSNVSSPQEMVRLAETVRHFEALQKIVQGYDEALEKTIRKLGEF
jgi:flagellar basal-body rod protein FlgF